MPPIPSRPPKGSNLLPLQDTLSDLSLLRSRTTELSSLLDHAPTMSKTDKETEEVLQRSYDFVNSTRAALDMDVNVTAQGERIETVRATLEEINAGFS